MATLAKSKDWYYAQFYNASRTPSRKRIPLKTRTRRTAEAKRRELEDAYALGKFDPWAPAVASEEAPQPALATLGEAYRAFLNAKSKCRKASRDNYRWVLGLLVEHAGEHLPTSALTTRSVQRWLDAASIGAASKNSYRARAGIFARWLVRQGALEKDVTKGVTVERAPDKFSSKLLTPAQLEVIVKAARASSTPYVADAAMLAFYLALRLSEVCALRTSWVDLEARRLTVRQDETFQTKNGRDVIKPIPAAAYDVLARLMERAGGADDYLVKNTRGRRMEPKHLSKAFKKVVRDCGLPETIIFHSCRHGGISKVVAGGASIEAARRFADHSTIHMTARYVHLLDEQLNGQILAAMR